MATITYRNNWNGEYREYHGNSAETKPITGLDAGMFTETDTGDVYLFNKATTTWINHFSLRR